MREKFWMWLAWKLPRPLVYWCAMRVGAAATTPPNGWQETVPELLFMDAIERWDKPRNRMPPIREIIDDSQGADAEGMRR